MNKLTVIIPFLNEGAEIEHTIKSIRDTAGDQVDILLINDNSQDNYNYEKVANDYHARYLQNNIRQGVANSRNQGVKNCNSEYFLIIDGHMRFYHNNWWKVYLEHLENDSRAIYCCKCKILDDQGNETNKKDGLGAVFHFFGEDFNKVLDRHWIKSQSQNKSDLEEVPCVLGATYAASKEYWEKIDGLNGLRYYGSSETFMSLKTWLEGGSCKVIKSVTIGHLFRQSFPYRSYMTDSIYNKLFIAEMLLPDKYKSIIHEKIKLIYPYDYYLAKQQLVLNKVYIKKTRHNFQRLISRDFEDILNFNSKWN